MRPLTPGLLSLALTATASCAATKSPNLPVVDLGYELHQAFSYNWTTDIYTFSNVRYAQAPVGDLRFRAPMPPLTNHAELQTGAGPRVCPQGVPLWQAKAFGPTGMYSRGKAFSLESWERILRNCLFLDVHVPRKVFQSAKKLSVGCCQATVLVWIHGGGYTFGSKNGVPTPGYDPAGLLRHTKEWNDEEMIFVALNYRLGALGFLSGPEVEEHGALNAGLLDQRLDLDWVQENIHLFGGSPKRVTVMGESAGGGSALIHMLGSPDDTDIKAPFSQVISQSPVIMPTTKAPESAYRDFLSLLNVNARQIGAAPSANYIHGPVLDGKVIPDLPHVLLKQGAFDHSVKVLAAHNSFEGSFFFDPEVKGEKDFMAWLRNSVPGLADMQRETLATSIYPPSFDNDVGYVDQSSRQMSLWARRSSTAHRFNATPGLHTQDLKYTFNDPQSPAFQPVAQDILQTVITTFLLRSIIIKIESLAGVLMGGFLVLTTKDSNSVQTL
ncbi:Alpha/Beta hydrolase protein [Thelonectria olida]|uniref:Carboxylic ester hydrolase n=1 Tax=Thelonectria olida TaxID=1576542 RepID=A0A9P8W1A9_9HYPO|nr:Alpha/Beta hydrolase protein [Thelonectria olida]